MKSGQRIVCLSPHSDDAELGMGGTIAKMFYEGNEIFNVVFSFCDSAQLAQEARNSEAILRHKLVALDYPVRNFHVHRQQILDDMLRLKSEIRPDIVFIPSTDDVHQDHQVIAGEARRAFKHCSLLGYELPWNTRDFATEAFSELLDWQVAQKYKAVSQYKSQAHRRYTEENAIFCQAYFRGVQSNTRFAEAFEVIRFNL